MFVAGCGRVSFDPLEGCTLEHLVDEPYANSLAGADGTNTPYVVCTGTQLARLGERPEDWNKTIVLGGDVDLAGIDVTPVGTMTMPFLGTFDGGGHSISNLRLDRPTEDNIGLFGVIGQGSHLTNVTLHGVDITGSTQVGALLGFGQDEVLVDKIRVDGVVRGDQYVGGAIGYVDCESATCHQLVVHDVSVDIDVAGPKSVGGVMGGSYVEPVLGRADLANLHAAGHVACTYLYCGGIIGEMMMATLDSSSSSASMDCASSCGGAVGTTVFSSTLIIRTFATGDVTCSDSCGGLTGGDETSIEKSYATGRVQCGGSTCAGLATDVSAHVYESYSTGDVIAPGGTQVAGLVADFYGTEVRDSFTSGHIVGLDYVGGLIAQGGQGVVRSYSTAVVTGRDHVGGLIGQIGSTVAATAATDSFAAATVNGMSPTNEVSPLIGTLTGAVTTTGDSYDASSTCTNSAGSCTMMGTSVTPTSALFTATTAPLSSWDFVNVWQEVPGGFPRLRGTP